MGSAPAEEGPNDPFQSWGVFRLLPPAHQPRHRGGSGRQMWLAGECHAFGFRVLPDRKWSVASTNSGGPGESAGGNTPWNAGCGAPRGGTHQRPGPQARARLSVRTPSPASRTTPRKRGQSKPPCAEHSGVLSRASMKHRCWIFSWLPLVGKAIRSCALYRLHPFVARAAAASVEEWWSRVETFAVEKFTIKINILHFSCNGVLYNIELSAIASRPRL